MEFYTSAFDAAIEASLKTVDSLHLILQRFARLKGILEDAFDHSLTEFAYSELWPEVPKVLTALLKTHIDTLFASVLKLACRSSSIFGASPMALMKKAVARSDHATTHSLFSVLTAGAQSRSPTRRSSANKYASESPSKRLSLGFLHQLGMDSLSTHGKAPDTTAFIISTDETILHIKSIRAINVHDCNKNKEFTPLKNAYVEFSVGSVTERVEFVFDASSESWTRQVCDLQFVLDSQVEGKVLKCTVFYPRQGLGNIIGDASPYGKVKVPLILIGNSCISI
jgi:hypothetical protein